MSNNPFPALEPGYEPTRATLHAYAHATSAIARAHAEPDPRWWHASLKPVPGGLAAEPVAIPDGGDLWVRMDLRAHEVVAAAPHSEDRFDMRAGMTGTEMGEAVVAVAARLGLADEYERDRFEDDRAATYDPAAASAFGQAFEAAASVLTAHRASLSGETGPVQVWPHGFDIAFEWFGRQVTDDDGNQARTQINFGLYPAGEPYFYSSPWPFDPSLVSADLPHDATWNTEWNGAVLPYATVQSHPDGPARFLEFASAVFEAATPSMR